jgi:hypothetical protein
MRRARLLMLEGQRKTAITELGGAELVRILLYCGECNGLEVAVRTFRHQILEWKSTGERYIAIVQAMDRFDPSTLHEVKRSPDETWIVGRLKDDEREDLYAIGLRRMTLEYAEARERAKAVVDRYNELMEQGKDPLGQ